MPGVINERDDGYQQVCERGAETGEHAPTQRQRQHRVRRVHHEQDVPHEPLLRQEVQTRHDEACIHFKD